MIGVSCCKSFHFYWWPPVWCCHHVEKLDNSFNDDNICHISIFLYFLVFQIPKMRLGSLLLLICVLMVISDYLSLWHFFGLNNTPEKNLWTFAEKWFWGSLYLSWKNLTWDTSGVGWHRSGQWLPLCPGVFCPMCWRSSLCQVPLLFDKGKYKDEDKNKFPFRFYWYLSFPHLSYY